MTNNSAIPVVDFSRWYNGAADDKQQVALELADACRRVGFVYVVNHGVADELLDEAFGWSKKLFDLPTEKKMLAPHPPGKSTPWSDPHSQRISNLWKSGPNVHRGYSWPGLEKVSQYVHKEGEDSDAEDEDLRKVQDCKVRSY